MKSSTNKVLTALFILMLSVNSNLMGAAFQPDVVMADAPWSYWQSTKNSGRWTIIKFLEGGDARVVVFKEDPANPLNYGGIVSYGNASWSTNGKKIVVSGSSFSGTLDYMDSDGEHRYGVLDGAGMRFSPEPEVPSVVQIYYPEEIKFFYTGK